MCDINEGSKPVASEKEKENIWYNNEYVLSTIDLGCKTLGYNSLSKEDLIKTLGANCVVLDIKLSPGIGRRCKSFCIGGQLYALNKHLLPDEDIFEICVINGPSGVGLNTNPTVRINRSDVFLIDDSDLCFIKMRGMVPKKNFEQLFPKGEIFPKTNGFYLRRSLDGSLEVIELRRIQYEGEIQVSASEGSHKLWGALAKVGSKNGDCGSICVAESAYGPILLGIHMLGHSTHDHVKFLHIDRTMIDRAQEYFGKIVCASNINLGAPSQSVKLLDLHKKSEVRFVAQGLAEVYGSLSLPRACGKSMVENTIMNGYLTTQGFETKYTKPDLQSWRPWHLALTEMVNPASNFNYEILKSCRKAFSEDIKKLISKDLFVKELIVYDLETAINGQSGVTFVDKMNRNTSMGHPYNKSKRYYLLHTEPTDINPDPVTFTEEILASIKQIEINYREGKRNNCIFRASLKDEPVTFEKASEGKTRVFAGAPAAWSVVVRKYLLSSIRFMQLNQHIFECACGISCQSSEWERLFEHMTHFGKHRMVAGDFKKFDKRMCSMIILEAFEFLKDLLKHSGNFSSKDILVIDGIAYDTAFNWMNYNGTLIQFFGGNPSGHPLTVVINSIVNALYMRYCFTEITEKSPTEFKKFVRLMTYGDDNFLNVSGELSGFDHTSIQKCLSKYGIDYTMADKVSKSVPFIHIDRVTFLKRSFRFDTLLNHFVAPLEYDSIEKMLMTWTASKTISKEEQALAVLSSAHMEMFWHGKEAFDNFNKLVMDIVAHLRLEDWMTYNVFLDYEGYKQRFLKTFSENE